MAWRTIKIGTVLLLLTCTCFFTQCHSCQKKDPVTKRVLPGQVFYTLSVGFPFPYFDIQVLNVDETHYRYAVADEYRVPVSAGVNLLFMASLLLLLGYLASRNAVRLNRLLLITVVLAMLFSLSLLVPYYPEFVQAIAVYLYLYPVGFIGAVFENLKIDLPGNEIPPRLYLVLLIIGIYYAPGLVIAVKNRIRRRGAKRIDTFQQGCDN